MNPEISRCSMRTWSGVWAGYSPICVCVFVCFLRLWLLARPFVREVWRVMFGCSVKAGWYSTVHTVNQKALNSFFGFFLRCDYYITAAASSRWSTKTVLMRYFDRASYLGSFVFSYLDKIMFTKHPEQVGVCSACSRRRWCVKIDLALRPPSPPFPLSSSQPFLRSCCFSVMRPSPGCVFRIRFATILFQ